MLSSSLLREMRDQDPRRWLHWALTALIEHIDEGPGHPRGEAIREECVEMRDHVDSWPDNLYSPAEARAMMERVDALKNDLQNPDAAKKAAGAARTKKGNTTYSWTPGPANPRKKGKTTPSDKPRAITPPQRPEPRKTTSSKPPQEPLEGTILSEPPDDAPPPEKKPPEKAKAKAPADEAAAESDPPEEVPPSAMAVRAPDLPMLELSEVTHSPVRQTPPQPPVRASEPPVEITTTALTAEVEILGEDETSLDRSLFIVSDPKGAAAEAYRALFFRIDATSEARTILVTTCAAGEDGASCASNLALAMAQGTEEKVLLLETRFDNPGIANLFGFQPKECFGRRLARHRRKRDATWRIPQLGQTNLSLLAVDPAQTTVPALDAQALGDVLDSLVPNRFGYAVVYGPASYGGSDARYVARCVDGVVLAVKAGTTRRGDIRRAVSALDGVPVLGYVLLEG